MQAFSTHNKTTTKQIPKPPTKPLNKIKGKKGVTIKDEYERIMAIRGAKNLLDAHGTLRLKLDAFYS